MLQLLSSEYIAGFFDGEGCIDIPYNKPSSSTGQHGGWMLRITIANTIEEPIRKIRESCGGSVHVYSRKGRRDVYQYVATGKKAYDFLFNVVPYLIVKKEQAIIAMQFYELHHGRRGPGNILTKDDIDSRNSFRERLKSLKKECLEGIGAPPITVDRSVSK